LPHRVLFFMFPTPELCRFLANPFSLFFTSQNNESNEKGRVVGSCCAFVCLPNFFQKLQNISFIPTLFHGRYFSIPLPKVACFTPPFLFEAYIFFFAFNVFLLGMQVYCLLPKKRTPPNIAYTYHVNPPPPLICRSDPGSSAEPPPMVAGLIFFFQILLHTVFQRSSPFGLARPFSPESNGILFTAFFFCVVSCAIFVPRPPCFVARVILIQKPPPSPTITSTTPRTARFSAHCTPFLRYVTGNFPLPLKMVPFDNHKVSTPPDFTQESLRWYHLLFWSCPSDGYPRPSLFSLHFSPSFFLFANVTYEGTHFCIITVLFLFLRSRLLVVDLSLFFPRSETQFLGFSLTDVVASDPGTAHHLHTRRMNPREEGFPLTGLVKKNG